MNIKFERDTLLGQLKSNSRVAVSKLRTIARNWVRENKEIDSKTFIAPLDLLYSGPSREEKVLASMIVGLFPTHLVTLKEARLDLWLGQLAGWEEVDSVCDEIDIWFRADQKRREHLLRVWNRHSQIEKRRASLVVLCSSVSKDSSVYLADLSFECIDILKGETHAMITKAISWLLRSLIKYHKNEVEKYLKQNAATLPKIAVREVARKLETGKK